MIMNSNIEVYEIAQYSSCHISAICILHLSKHGMDLISYLTFIISLKYAFNPKHIICYHLFAHIFVPQNFQISICSLIANTFIPVTIIYLPSIINICQRFYFVICHLPDNYIIFSTERRQLLKNDML